MGSPIIYSNRRAEKFRRWTFAGGYCPYKTATPGDYYDVATAVRALNFAQKFVVHTKGELAGKPLKLETWEAAIIAALFGWKRADGRRRFRHAFVFIPRKNGKSKIAEVVALLLTFADKEPGAEVYSIAADRKQAGIVFEGAKQCVENSPLLMGRSKTYRGSFVVYDLATGAISASYIALSSDANTKAGYNPHGVIADELHAHPKRDLCEMMRSGMGARRQPLFFAITSAGLEAAGIGFEQYEYAKRVAGGIIADPTFLPVIYEAGSDDDWRLVKTWAKANPNLGVSIEKQWLREQAKRAEANPAELNTFLAFHLNRWVSSRTRALDPGKWSACYSPRNEWPDLTGCDAFGGVDLAHSRDLCAFVLIWELDGILYVHPRFWLPRDQAIEIEKSNDIPYSTWAREGWIELTEGDVTDYGFIRTAIKSDIAGNNCQGIGVDPHNASHLLNLLTHDDGIGSIYKFGQSTANLNEPYKDLILTRIPSRQIVHDGNPVMAWNAANTATKIDAGERWRPIKAQSTPGYKIDGMVALTMANGMRIAHRAGEKRSIYQERGILAF